MKFLEFVLDTLHAAILYPSGLTRPHITRGYFTADDKGHYQQHFFTELLAHGFQRTPFQLIFPGQTAGLIRKIDPPIDGMDEIHIRFYDDGTIAAELEYGRFSLGHWREERTPSLSVLEELLNTECPSFSTEIKKNIQRQFQERDYSTELSFPQTSLCDHPFSRYLQYLGVTAFLSAQTTLTAIGAMHYFSKGEFYSALEPTLGLFLAEIPLLAVAYSSFRYKDHVAKNI